MDKAEKIAEDLKQKIENLLFTSEGEYPFEVIHWKRKDQNLTLSSESILNLCNCPPDTSITVVKLDDFLRRATKAEDWHGETEKLNVLRYQELQNYLTQTLEGIQVFKIGQVEIDTYIVGKADSDIVGLKTKVVQT
jgi:hypothetical protein